MKNINTNAIQSLFTFKTWAIPLVLSFLISACGGGGGDSNTGTGANNNFSTGGANVAPTVDAGADRAVNAGETVEIKAIANDSDGSITARSISQTGGPKVALQAIDLDMLHFTFVAPSTGVEASVELVFKVAVTDNNGATATDTVVFTVNRVNQAPMVNAGSDLSVRGLETVALTSNSSDPDGEIVAYLWEQTGGAEVELIESNTSSPSFTAPSTEENLQLTFSLTVTDNDGLTATDHVAVEIISENAPNISLVFPPALGAAVGQNLSAYGTVEAIEGDTITSIVVSTGIDSVTATIDESGNWRVDQIATPEDKEFSLKVKATDSSDRTSEVVSELVRSNVSMVGEGNLWMVLTAITLDVQNQKAYVLTTDVLKGEMQLVPVDLKTGERGEPITDFTDQEQGTTVTAFTSIDYSQACNCIYLSSSPENTTLPRQVIAVSLEDGSRTIVSSSTRGIGELLINPTGIDADDNGTLYVADNGQDMIFAIDVETGDRTIIADEVTEEISIEFPLFLSWNDASSKLYVLLNYVKEIVPIVLDTTGENVSSELIGVYETGSILDAEYQGIAVDPTGIFLYILWNDGELIEINTSTREFREISPENRIYGTDNASGMMAYDSATNLLYIVDNMGSLFAVDVQSGFAVTLSRP